MFKNYGVTERYDALEQTGRREWTVFAGMFEDETGVYQWRKRYTKKPTLKEVKEDILAAINADIDERIIKGFEWRGIKVWLSTENQSNFKAAYDLNVQTGGALLPIKFKLGEDGEEEPVYHTFEDMEEFTDFFTKAVAYVNNTLNSGWLEKDSFRWEDFGG